MGVGLGLASRGVSSIFWESGFKSIRKIVHSAPAGPFYMLPLACGW